jgi:hypothetical protein
MRKASNGPGNQKPCSRPLTASKKASTAAISSGSCARTFELEAVNDVILQRSELDRSEPDLQLAQVVLEPG